jgi:hypothetical protein
MKTVLFCGGLGTRIRDYSENVPKPMIPIGGRPRWPCSGVERITKKARRMRGHALQMLPPSRNGHAEGLIPQ